MIEIERAIEILERDDTGVYEIFEKPSYVDLLLKLLRAELEREKNPLTWNERINQMTAEEKAEWMNCKDFCRVSEISIEDCNAFNDCKECMIAFLNSPYTEGETT